MPIDGTTAGSNSGPAFAGGDSSSGTALRDLELCYMLVTKHPYVRGCAELIADAVCAEGYDVVPRGAEDAQPLSADADKRVGLIHDFFALANVRVTDRIDPRTMSIKLNAAKTDIAKYVTRT